MRRRAWGSLSRRQTGGLCPRRGCGPEVFPDVNAAGEKNCDSTENRIFSIF